MHALGGGSLAGVAQEAVAFRGQAAPHRPWPGLALVLGFLGVAPSTLALFEGADKTAHTYIFWYGGLLLLLCLIYPAVRMLGRRGPWTVAALATAGVLLVGALDIPLNQVEPKLTRATSAETGRRTTPALYRALTWIRSNSPAGSTIAVNNGEALEFAHAAFSERRVFFGGWGYSLRVRETGYASVAFGTRERDCRLSRRRHLFLSG